MNFITVIIYRGNNKNGTFEQYDTEVAPGMVVLDAVKKIQEEKAHDLGIRWNCKAGKCGSCAAEVNGKPVLMCMQKIEDLPKNQPINIRPLKAFPIIKDLVSDVSWNYEQNKKIKPFTYDTPSLARRGSGGGLSTEQSKPFTMYQRDIERSKEFRKCIECFLCQDVCHVLRTHQKHDEFAGPRFFTRIASLDMHPLDTENRAEFLKKQAGIGLCNITKCCTSVCPENIRITDNAIIPLKERVADNFYDPVKRRKKKKE